MKTNDLIFLACWLSQWAVCAYKYRALRRAPRENRRFIRPICAATFFTGSAFFCAAPSAGTAIDHLTGVPSLSMLLACCSIMAMICSLRIMLLLWLNPAWLQRRVLSPVLIYGLVAAVMAVLFALGAPVEEHHTEFAASFGRMPFLAEFLVLFFGANVVGLADITAQYWIRIQETPADQPWLRRGLRVSAAGILFPIAYGVISLVAVVGGWFGIDLDYWSVNVAPYVAGSGIPVVVGGITIAVWGPKLGAARLRVSRWRADLRDFRQLRPLWQLLLPVDAAMVHQPVSFREKIGLEANLFWRVIEINDWLHQLRTYRIPSEVDDSGMQSGAPGTASARAEAARIVAAVAAKAQGRKAEPSSLESGELDLPMETGTAFVAERARLVLIARALP